MNNHKFVNTVRFSAQLYAAFYTELKQYRADLDCNMCCVHVDCATPHAASSWSKTSC